LNDYSLKADQLQGNKTACNDATESHNTHKSGCDGEQGTFEARFCEYRTELTTLKADSSTCYADAKSSYDEISGNTPGKAAKLQAEMKAFQKILCYLKVWLDSGTVNASIAGQCEDTAIDTSELAINDPGIPDEKLVDDSSVVVFPGSDGWLGKYADIPHNTVVVHCQGHSHDYDSTTTTTPTTTTTEAALWTWTQIGSDHCKCISMSGKGDLVASQAECQQSAISNGKSYYAYAVDQRRCHSLSVQGCPAIDCGDPWQWKIFHYQQAAR
jgi:hypothetical protein